MLLALVRDPNADDDEAEDDDWEGVGTRSVASMGEPGMGEGEGGKGEGKGAGERRGWGKTGATRRDERERAARRGESVG